MIHREQVSLNIVNEDTANLTKRLKQNKLLKPTLIKFLDKYSQNPESVEMWLNEDETFELEGGVDNEKLTDLKKNLAIFSAFVEVANSANESNVESYMDGLEPEAYWSFKTNFEKSQQIIENGDTNETLAIGSSAPVDDKIAKQVESLQEQLKEMKMLVSSIVNNNPAQITEQKISATIEEPVQVQVEEKTVEKKQEIVEDVPVVTEDVKVEPEKKEENSGLNLSPAQADSEPAEEEEIDFDAAFDILSELG